MSTGSPVSAGTGLGFTQGALLKLEKAVKATCSDTAKAKAPTALSGIYSDYFQNYGTIASIINQNYDMGKHLTHHFSNSW